MKAKAASFSNKINNSEPSLASTVVLWNLQEESDLIPTTGSFPPHLNVTFVCFTFQKWCQTVGKLTIKYCISSSSALIGKLKPTAQTAAHSCSFFLNLSLSSLSLWLSLSWSPTSSSLPVSCDTILFFWWMLPPQHTAHICCRQFAAGAWDVHTDGHTENHVKCCFSTKTAQFHAHFEVPMLEEMMSCCLTWVRKQLFLAFLVWNVTGSEVCCQGLWNEAVYSWDVFTVADLTFLLFFIWWIICLFSRCLLRFLDCSSVSLMRLSSCS